MNLMKKRWGFLVVFAALLCLSAFLMSRGDKPKKPERALRAEFPRFPQPWEEQRNQKRRTLAPPASSAADMDSYRPKRDPLLVALPYEPKTSAVVFEVSALKESPIGQAWLDCMLEKQADEKDKKRGRDRFKEEFGIDLLNDVERVAISSQKVAILSVAQGAADFSRIGWDKRNFGERAVIYENEEKSAVFATWGDELVLVGQSVKEIEASIDRLESKAPAHSPVIPDWSAYGDIYGALSPDELADMLPDEQSDIRDKLRNAVNRVDLHVDTSDDVAIVADVNGDSQDDIRDLAKTMGGALSVARVAAANDGDERLRELLDYATIHPNDGRFSIDVALPLEVLKEMGPCRKAEPLPKAPR